MSPNTLITHAVAALAAAALAGWLAWTWQANAYGQQMASLQRTQAVAALRAAETATRQTLEMQDAKDQAIAQAAQRNALLARSAAAVRAERDGLRDDLATARSQLPGAACTAVREYAATLTAVFGECAAAIERLAAQADGHASDALMLLGAWPRKNSDER